MELAGLEAYQTTEQSSDGDALPLLADEVPGNRNPRQEVFEAIYETHSVKILNFARRLVGMDQADDITNETFIRAWNKLDSFVDQGYGIGPWLIRIAYNLCMDAHRGERFDFVDDPNPHLEAQTVEVPFLRNIIDKDDVEELLEGLKENERAIFIAIGLRGLSPREYSEELGISEAALKARIHRARQRKIHQNTDAETILD